MKILVNLPYLQVNLVFYVSLGCFNMYSNVFFKNLCSFSFFFKKKYQHLYKWLTFPKPLSENLGLGLFFFQKSVYRFMKSYLSIFIVKIKS